MSFLENKFYIAKFSFFRYEDNLYVYLQALIILSVHLLWNWISIFLFTNIDSLQRAQILVHKTPKGKL